MAHESVYEVKTVELQDGSTVDLRPANIAALKKGQKELDRLSEVKTTDETLDVLLDVCVILLKKQRPDLEDRELAEELLDLDTVYLIIEVFLGVKLNDPKLIETAMRVAAEQERAVSAK